MKTKRLLVLLYGGHCLLMAGFLETVEAFQKHILKKKQLAGWFFFPTAQYSLPQCFSLFPSRGLTGRLLIGRNTSDPHTHPIPFLCSPFCVCCLHGLVSSLRSTFLRFGQTPLGPAQVDSTPKILRNVQRTPLNTSLSTSNNHIGLSTLLIKNETKSWRKQLSQLDSLDALCE